jgi:hypothetical protein
MRVLFIVGGLALIKSITRYVRFGVFLVATGTP